MPGLHQTTLKRPQTASFFLTAIIKNSLMDLQHIKDRFAIRLSKYPHSYAFSSISA